MQVSERDQSTADHLQKIEEENNSQAFWYFDIDTYFEKKSLFIWDPSLLNTNALYIKINELSIMTFK